MALFCMGNWVGLVFVVVDFGFGCEDVLLIALIRTIRSAFERVDVTVLFPWRRSSVGSLGFQGR